MPKNKTTYCSVCGLDQGDFPWGEDGDSPNYTICDCCGVEFGYTDADQDGIESYRKYWIEKGCIWFWPKSKPEGWSLEEQLKNIGIDPP